MIELLKKMLPEIHLSLVSNDDWDSLIINRRKPWTYRVFRQFGDYRVCLHAFDACDVHEAFLHPHPWPGAFLVLEGSYIQKLGFSQTKDKDSVPDMFYRELLSAGSCYEILDQRIWHSVQPLTRCYTIMLNGKPWDEPHQAVKTTKGKDLEKMLPYDLNEHKRHFQRLLDEYMYDDINYVYGRPYRLSEDLNKPGWVCADCKHEEVEDGPKIPRSYGSYKTKVCIKCDAWRKFDWHDVPVSNWLNLPIVDAMFEIIDEEDL